MVLENITADNADFFEAFHPFSSDTVSGQTAVLLQSIRGIPPPLDNEVFLWRGCSDAHRRSSDRAIWC